MAPGKEVTVYCRPLQDSAVLLLPRKLLKTHKTNPYVYDALLKMFKHFDSLILLKIISLKVYMGKCVMLITFLIVSESTKELKRK